MTTQHEQIEEHIAAYTLDALSDAERATVLPGLLDHLSGCEACRIIYHDFRAVAGDLALGAPAEPVSAQFEARVMAAIREKGPPSAVKGPRSRMAMRAVLAASLAAVTALGLISYSAVGDVRRERARAQRSQQVLAVLADPTVQRFPLTSPAAQGTVALAVAGDGRAVLTGFGLPQIPADRVYELWLMQGDTPIPAGVFTAAAGEAILVLEHDPRGFDAAAITVEAGPRGSRAPTTDAIYSARLRG